MSEFPRGPWRIVPPPTADNGNPWRVADAEETVAIIPNRPREATARLIAAAPVMLVALRAAEIALEMNLRSGDPATLASVREAIRQAEGRHQ